MITGSDIKEARNRAGLSQEALALAVGVTLRTIGNWERSATVPRNKLPILREVLGDQLGVGESSSPRLRAASDEELANEIVRRLKSARAGSEDGHVAKPAEKSDEDDDGAGGTVTPIRPAGPPPVPAGAAADDPGVPSQYDVQADAQDETGESPDDPSPDEESQDPDDEDPA